MNPNESTFEAQFSMESNPTGVVEESIFKLLVLGDWSGDAAANDSGSYKIREIDRDNFDEMMSVMGTKIDMEMADGSELTLEFENYEDLHPDNIYRNVSLFEDLREYRRRLKNESTFNSAAREVRQLFGADKKTDDTAETEQDLPAADNLLDAILAKPEGGAVPPPKRHSTELGSLIKDLVRPHLVTFDENEQASLVRLVDEAISELMRSILHHPKFQEIEAAWRGLYYLVRKTATDTDLKIYVTDVKKEDLANELKSTNDLTQTKLYKALIKDTLETPGGEPFAAVVGNYFFGPNVEDVAALMRIMKLAAVANAPFLSSVSGEMVEFGDLASSDLSVWKPGQDEKAAGLWSTLKAQKEAEHVGLTFPRFITRYPYGRETDPAETFEFEEFTGTPKHEHYSWAGGHFLAAQLLAASYSEYGWEMGRALKQDVEGLPLHIYKEDGETIYKPCSEVLLTQELCEKLMEDGLMILISYKNTDRVKLSRFQSIADTELKGMWARS